MKTGINTCLRYLKKKIKKDKKEYSPFPNSNQPWKEDLEMDSGKYFLTKDQK